jgi:hypothetical protein
MKLPTEHTEYTENFLIIISVYSVCSVGYKNQPIN